MKKGWSLPAGASELVAKYRYVLLMAAVGILLMLLPSFGGEKGQDGTSSTQQESESTFSLEQTQQELEEILSSIDGVGRVQVMLTVSSGTQRVYQSDHDVSYTGSAAAPEDYSSTGETVLLDRGSDGEEALETQEFYPSYVGALVVCDGAGEAGTVLKVKEAVSVLTGLGSDCISVAQRSED